MEYFDKNGKKICAGMLLRMEDGSVEKVYETTNAYGDPDLGISASNEAFLKAHPDWVREYYSLSTFNMKFTEIYNKECVK